MADFNQPTNASLYSDVLSILNNKITSVAKMDFTGDTNVPAGAWRLNSTSGLLETWSGSAWTIQGYVLKATVAGTAKFIGDFLDAGGSNASSLGGLTNARFYAGLDPTGGSNSWGGIVLGSGVNGNLPFVAASRTGNGNPLNLTFFTDGAERVRITTTGNVGIGTTNPTLQLDMGSTATSNGGLTNAKFYAGLDPTGGSNSWGGVILGSGPNANLPFIAASRTGNGNPLALAIFTDGAERARFTTTGNFAVGTSTAGGRLTVNVSNDRDFVVGRDVTGIKFVESKLIYDGTTAFGAAVHVEDSSGNYLLRRNTSSAKYKKDIETLQDSYADKLMQFRPVYYRSKSAQDVTWFSTYGLIAEEIAAIDPRLAVYRFDESDYEDVEVTLDDNTVTTKKTLKPGSVGDPEGVNYNAVLAFAINVIQRLAHRVEALEAQIAPPQA